MMHRESIQRYEIRNFRDMSTASWKDLGRICQGIFFLKAAIVSRVVITISAPVPQQWLRQA